MFIEVSSYKELLKIGTLLTNTSNSSQNSLNTLIDAYLRCVSTNSIKKQIFNTKIIMSPCHLMSTASS
jgi:hypothetical protein